MPHKWNGPVDERLLLDLLYIAHVAQRGKKKWWVDHSGEKGTERIHSVNILPKSKLGGHNKTSKYKKHLKRYYLRQKEPSQY